MIDVPDTCPAGWGTAEILAYIEGDLDLSSARDLELHFEECPHCKREFESLSRLNSILKQHSEIFHPSDDELHAFALSKSDSEGQIASHLETCPECEKNIQAFREMIELQGSLPVAGKMPEALKKKLKSLQGDESGFEKTGVLDFIWGFLKKPLSIPIFGLASAAAVLIVAVLIVPMWRTLKELPQPSTISVEPPPVKEADRKVESQELKDRGLVRTFESKPKTESEASAVPAAPMPAAQSPQQVREAEKQRLPQDAAPRKRSAAAMKAPASEKNKVDSLQQNTIGQKADSEGMLRSDARREERAWHGDAAGETAASPKTTQPRGAELEQDGKTASRDAVSAGSDRDRSNQSDAGFARKPPMEPGAGKLRELPERPAEEYAKRRLEQSAPIQGVVPPASSPTVPHFREDRTRVTVRITDKQGNSWPGAIFIPSRDLLDRYEFRTHFGESEFSSDEKRPASRAAEPLQHHDYTVVITLGEANDKYDIEARLFDARGGSVPLKTVAESEIGREMLSSSINRAISSLLSGY